MKTPVLKSLINKVAVLQACNFLNKRLEHRCFPVNIAKILITLILKNIWEQLLLKFYNLGTSPSIKSGKETEES